MRRCCPSCWPQSRSTSPSKATAVIPPRKNASHWKKSSPASAQRNEAIRACKRLGSSIWKKWSGYHRRSLVETKMHCFKRLGERVGYPTKNSLKGWYREYQQRQDLPKGYAGREPKFSQAQKAATLEHYLAHD